MKVHLSVKSEVEADSITFNDDGTITVLAAGVPLVYDRKNVDYFNINNDHYITIKT